MKNCTPLWREAHFEVKMYKTPSSGALLAVEMSKKCTPLWREAHFQVKVQKDWVFGALCRFAGQAQGIVHVVKSEQT